MISELACQARKSNHDHKRESKCVPGLLLKRYHKTSRQSSMTSSKNIVHKEMDICGILKMGSWRAYLDNKPSAKMRNKVSSIMCKIISCIHEEETQSIKYQTNNIEENIMNVGPPPKP